MSSTSCSCLLKGLERRITAEMITFFNTPLIQQISSHIILILCITLVNGMLLFATVALIIRRMKQIPAKHKHLIWLFLLYCFIAIPLLSMLIPSIDIHHASIPVVETLAVENYTALPETDTRLSTSSQKHEENHNTNSQRTGSATDTVRPITTIRWQTAVMLIWLAGVILSMFRIIAGRIGLHCLIKKSVPVDSIPFSSLVETLCNRLGIKKKIHVLGNSHCITPFTCYLLKPVVLLPANTAGWSEDRLRIVLLHELSHIQRRDYISRVIARFLCTFFWFIPPVWIAYHRMQIEEEKACDASVIGTGVRASDYAGHIIDIARSSRGMVLSLMLQLFFGQRSTLEPRIRNILSLKKPEDTFKIGGLLRILFICLVCLLVLQAVNPVTARESGFFKREAPRELLYGRWIDTHEYEIYKRVNCEKIGQKKIVFDQDGSIHIYATPSSPEYSYNGENGFYTIEESHIDRKGYCWYKVISKYPYADTTWYELWRIDPSGSTLELANSSAEYPSHINPDKFNYSIFHKM